MVASSIEVNDAELMKKTAGLVPQPKTENTGDSILDGANMICNRIVYLGHAAAVNYRSSKDWEAKLNGISNELAGKVTKDYVKTKSKKTKTKLTNDIEEFKRKILKQFDDNNKKVSKDFSAAAVSIKEMEKKTLWKITDCESLLQKRVTQDYVDTAIKELEEKMKRDVTADNFFRSSNQIFLFNQIEASKTSNFAEVFNKIALIDDKCKILDDSLQEKQKNNRKQLKELEEDLLKRLCPNEKFETYKKAVTEKLADIDSKIMMLDRRGSANEIMEKTSKLIKELEEKIFSLQREDVSILSIEIKLYYNCLKG